MSLDSRLFLLEERKIMNETEAEAMREESNDTQNSSHEQENRQRHNRGHRRGNRRHGQQQQRQQQAEASLNMSELRELADLVSQHGFTDFEFENENIRVRLRKELAPQIFQAAPQAVSYTTPQQTPAATQQVSNQSAPQDATTNTESAAVSEDESLHKITSPIVGTFYRSPSPDADPFVKIGSQVTADEIVCIVEAMKLMNEIPAEVSGEIVKIYVENGQPVEYGQPLFGVKK
jgi:acetyl-CoA carboxylase biotin carboxyl carrier protein